MVLNHISFAKNIEQENNALKEGDPPTLLGLTCPSHLMSSLPTKDNKV